jgi:hypothetical protein
MDALDKLLIYIFRSLPSTILIYIVFLIVNYFLNIIKNDKDSIKHYTAYFIVIWIFSILYYVTKK